MSFRLTALACATLLSAAALAETPTPQPHPEATGEDLPEIRYFMDFEEALEITPRGRTEYYSEELGRDFTQWPIPWERQVYNAITDVGGSNTQQDHIGGFEYWVPFDEIPGEASFPMMKRLNLNAQRGYQRAIVHDHVALDNELAAYRAENQRILEDYRRASEESLQTVLDSANAILAKSEARRQARAAEERRIAFYTGECQTLFPDDAGSCDILAGSLVRDSYASVPPLKAAPDGVSPKSGDVFVTTPKGRFVARLDANYWVNWYRFDQMTAPTAILTPFAG